ncbi:MAG: hypothetical protein GNW80_10570 [Asgard group archaeon]|nr:hypothetical protein [Asgard group archaeon]
MATICQVSEEDLRINAEDMGLIIEAEYIIQPSESKEQKASDLLKAKRKQIVTEIVDKRIYRYDPEAKYRGTYSFIRGFSDPNTIFSLVVGKIIDKVTMLRTVIHPFEGKEINCKSSEERPHIEKIRKEISQLPDELLRLHVPLKKYTEFLVIPRIEKKLSKAEKIDLINKVTSEDNRMRTEAIQLAQNSVDEQKTKGKIIKEMVLRLPIGQLQTIPSNQIQQFLIYLKEICHFEIRKNFYKNPNFLDEYLFLLS